MIGKLYHQVRALVRLRRVPFDVTRLLSIPLPRTGSTLGFPNLDVSYEWKYERGRVSASEHRTVVVKK